MGGCMSDNDVPEEIFPDPQDGKSHYFKLVPAGGFSNSWLVLNQDGQKWLFLRNDSKWSDPSVTFTLENYVREDGEHGETLCEVQIEEQDVTITKSAEFEPDSDDDTWSWDELFTGEDDGEFEAKLKWKVARHGTLIIKGKRFSFSVKMSGTSKVEFAVEDGVTSEEPSKLETKVKKVKYAINLGGSPLKMEYENSDWSTAKRREWNAPGDFLVVSSDTANLEVTTEEESSVSASASVLLGFTIAQFFNPQHYVAELEKQTMEYGRVEVNKKRAEEQEE